MTIAWLKFFHFVLAFLAKKPWFFFWVARLISIFITSCEGITHSYWWLVTIQSTCGLCGLHLELSENMPRVERCCLCSLFVLIMLNITLSAYCFSGTKSWFDCLGITSVRLAIINHLLVSIFLSQTILLVTITVNFPNPFYWLGSLFLLQWLSWTLYWVLRFICDRETALAIDHCWHLWHWWHIWSNCHRTLLALKFFHFRSVRLSWRHYWT